MTPDLTPDLDFPVADSNVKRKPGRPRKEPGAPTAPYTKCVKKTNKQNEPNESIATAVKQKRGRPRKRLVAPKALIVETECKTGESTPASVTAAAPESLLPFQVATRPATAGQRPASLDTQTQTQNQPLTKEILAQRVSQRLDVLNEFLSDDTSLRGLLGIAAMKGKLHDIGMYESNLIDRFIALKGDPSVLVGNTERGQLQAVLPRILALLEKRGILTATERKLELVMTSASGRTNGQGTISAENASGNGRPDVIDAIGRTTP